MKLRVGYLISGIVTGLIILFSFILTLPDGKLHVVFLQCGPGDAAYIRFPDGRDMVIDGGPDDKIINCLGRHMPFWDRHIDLVALTHPQKDHMQGLISVFARFDVSYFLRSDVQNTTEGYQKLMNMVSQKNVPIKYMAQQDNVDIGSTSLLFVWPSAQQIAKAVEANVLGASVGELNDYSLVLDLHYGTFDVLMTGDADSHVEPRYTGTKLADSHIEVLKVPHHGSKTGMTEAFVDWVKPELAVISVGKNSYGHPSKEAIDMLQSRGSRVLQTDKEGDIEVVSDGKTGK